MVKQHRFMFAIIKSLLCVDHLCYTFILKGWLDVGLFVYNIIRFLMSMCMYASIVSELIT